jgi:hypothetical protein
MKVNGLINKIKVKQTLYGPEETLMVPGVWSFQISQKSAHEGDKVVNSWPFGL